jgi:NADPH:quinone reductase-like Zn-dependent oxidoreductase
MRLTLKAINAELAKRGYDAHVEKGDSYFYFSAGEAADWLDRTVTAPNLSSFTIDQWMSEFERLKKLNKEILGAAVRKEPSKPVLEQKVWLVEKPGGPFRKIELDRPTPGANQVLVRISASGVNPLDTKIRAGKASHARHPLPAVLDLEMAGTVEEVGPGVKAFNSADEVYGMVRGVGGLQGTLAEFIAVDANLLAHKPKNLSMCEAAALPLSAITAWEGLVDRAQVRVGQKVLIQAGAGGVGHIAVQVARAFGAEVFATVSSDKKKIVESFGAVPIDYRSASVEEYVAAHTEGKEFDIVFDTVGGATLDASFEAVKRYTGHVVSCLGWGTHSLAPLSFRGATYSGVFTLLPLITVEGRAHHGKILAQAAAIVEAGKLRPLLNDQRFSVSDIDAAHALVESGALGRVVIEF